MYILKYCEENAIYDMIDFRPSPPADGIETQPVRLQQPKVFLCPSDLEDRMNTPTCAQGDNRWLGAGRTNYFGNGGSDTGRSFTVTAVSPAVDYREYNNGIYVTNVAIRTKQITDGMSKTAIYGEAIRGSGDIARVETPGDWLKIPGANLTADQLYTACTAITNPSTYTPSGFHFPCRGRNWVHGDYTTSRYNHIMPPNALSCATGTVNADPSINESGTATTASSRHNGGVNIACSDGSTHFVADNIDILVWHALGSRNGDEVVGSDF